MYEVSCEVEILAPGGESKTAQSVTYIWREAQIARFQVHDEEHIVLNGIREREEYVKARNALFVENALINHYEFGKEEVDNGVNGIMF